MSWSEEVEGCSEARGVETCNVICTDDLIGGVFPSVNQL